MKSLPVPEIEQIQAMLNGSIYDVLEQYVDNPRASDFRRFITVNRQRLIEHLVEHSDAAEEYFQRHANYLGGHDIERIRKADSGYVVVSMDHGKETCERHFHSLPDAVAEHILLNHGMF
jgi:hypothetical protein